MFKWSQIKFSIVLLSIPCLLLTGQNYFISNPYHNNKFNNPSYPMLQEYSIAQLNYRNHWPVSNMYTTYGASYYHHLDNLSSNIGAIFDYDNQYNGTFNKLSAGLNYAYKLQLSRRNNLLFGLQGIYNINKNNFSGLQFENPTASIPENQSKSFATINAGLGIVLDESHFFGISATNIYSGLPENILQLNASYIGNIRMKSYYSNTSIQPLLLVASNFSYWQMHYGVNLDFNGFKSGLLLRQYNNKLTTLVILLGISFENYEFVYTYDLNLSGAVTINPKMAAHEVTFLRKFQYKGRSNRHKAIKCPDI